MRGSRRKSTKTPNAAAGGFEMLTVKQKAARARCNRQRLAKMYANRLDRHALAAESKDVAPSRRKWHRDRAEKAREQLRKIDH